MTLDVDAAVEAVRLQVDVPAGHNRISISRVGPSGTKAYVRNLVGAVATPGTLTVYRDYEAPIGVPLTYTVETWNSATPATVTTQTGVITVPDGGCSNTWLTDLVRAQNTFQVVLEELAELDYDYPTGVHQILDRRTPVVTSDIANTPTFELSFLTDTDDQRLRARAILGNGVPVLLRTPPQDGIGNVYFSVTGWQEQRVVRLATQPARRFVTECVQVDRPDPGLFKPLVPVSYADVKATFATYAALKAARASYDALTYGPGSAEDVVPWPPTDV